MATSFSITQLASFLSRPAARVMEQVGRGLGVDVTVESEHVDTRLTSYATHDVVNSVKRNHASLMAVDDLNTSEPIVKLDELDVRSKGLSAQATSASVSSADAVAPSRPRRPKVRVLPQLAPTTAVVAPSPSATTSRLSAPPHVATPNVRPVVEQAPVVPSPPVPKRLAFVAQHDASPALLPSLDTRSSTPHEQLAVVAQHDASPALLPSPDTYSPPVRKRLVFVAPNDASPALLPSPNTRLSTATSPRALQTGSPESDVAQLSTDASLPRRRPKIRALSPASRSSELDPAAPPQPAPVHEPQPAGRKQLHFVPPVDGASSAFDKAHAPAHSAPPTPTAAPRASSRLPSAAGDTRHSMVGSARPPAKTTPSNATAAPTPDPDHATAPVGTSGPMHRHTFEEMLVDVLRDAARRHGLEV